MVKMANESSHILSWKLLLCSLVASAATLVIPSCEAFSTTGLGTTTGSISLHLRRSRTRTSVDASLDSAFPATSTVVELPKNPTYSHYDSIVVGGGPAGLLTAIMLSQKFGPDHKIAVCEQRAAIPPSPSDETVWNDVARFYLLGIGHRGQTALKHFGIWDDFVTASVEVQGRRDWQPGMTRVEDGRITPAKKDPPSRILARDKLVGLLHEHVVREYIQKQAAKVDLLYGVQVTPVNFGKEDDPDAPVEVRISPCNDIVDTQPATSATPTSYEASQEVEQVCNVEESTLVTTDFLIGADGAARTVAKAMENADTERYSRYNPIRRWFAKRPIRVTRFEDDNPRVYKSVPITLPPDWPRQLNYSARSRNSRITLEALPSDDKGNLCALLLIRPDDELAQANTPPESLRRFFDEEFPQFGALIDDETMARVALKPASKLPVFRFVGPRLHFGSRSLVLGDAAHTVKPYYGLGANTALEDVQVLSELLDASQRDIPTAVKAFSDQRAADAAALVTISRNMDRPGKWFLINFLLPLILDGIFHKLAPGIFGPNMFGMFQRKGIGFYQIQQKKRLDRALQLICLGGLATGIAKGLQHMVRFVSRATGQSSLVISIGMMASVAAAVLLRKTMMLLKPKPTTTTATTLEGKV